MPNSGSLLPTFRAEKPPNDLDNPNVSVASSGKRSEDGGGSEFHQHHQ